MKAYFINIGKSVNSLTAYIDDLKKAWHYDNPNNPKQTQSPAVTRQEKIETETHCNDLMKYKTNLK